MRLRRPLPAVQGDTLHIVGVGDNRIGKDLSSIAELLGCPESRIEETLALNSAI